MTDQTKPTDPANEPTAATAPDEGPCAVEVVDLCKRFGQNQVLRNVSLRIPEGKTTVIIGGSGCGKSVLVKHIIGLLTPDSGRIIVAGQDITALPEKRRQTVFLRMAMVFQGAALLNSLTVAENVGLGLKERRLKPPDEIDRTVQARLNQVGLEGHESTMPSELSGGMQKRAGLARALVMDPEIIIYDEPTTGLDPINAQNVDEMILQMKEETNVSSIVITHDMVSAFKVGDYIAMLHGGGIIERGTPDDIRTSSNPLVQEFLSRNR